MFDHQTFHVRHHLRIYAGTQISGIGERVVSSCHSRGRLYRSQHLVLVRLIVFTNEEDNRISPFAL